jgi:hypothetical protein
MQKPAEILNYRHESSCDSRRNILFSFSMLGGARLAKRFTTTYVAALGSYNRRSDNGAIS